MFMRLLSYRTKAVASLLAGLLASTVVASAQPDGPARPGRRPLAPPEADRLERPLRAGPGPGRMAPGMDHLFRVLTEEQRRSLREAMEGQREKIRDLEEKLRDARKDMFEAGLAEKFDEEAVRRKAMATAKLEAEMTVLRAKALSQIRPPLSPEQIERLKNPPPPIGDRPEGPPGRRRELRRDERGLPPRDGPPPPRDRGEPPPPRPPER